MDWTQAIQVAVYMGILSFITACWGYQKGYKEGRAFQRKITHKYRNQVQHAAK